MGSICLEWNLNACSLTSRDIPDGNKRKLCDLACQNGTDVCRSTSEFAHKVGLPPGGISLRPGSPCDNFQVRCREIREVDRPTKCLEHLENFIPVYFYVLEIFLVFLFGKFYLLC